MTVNDKPEPDESEIVKTGYVIRVNEAMGIGYLGTPNPQNEIHSKDQYVFDLDAIVGIGGHDISQFSLKDGVLETSVPVKFKLDAGQVNQVEVLRYASPVRLADFKFPKG